MTDIYETIAQLASLWPALGAALQRDTAGGEPSSGTWTAAAIVNADVLAAMITLDTEVPAAFRAGCDLTGERGTHRDLDTTLRALPRLASRMETTGHPAAAGVLAAQVRRWLRVTKRALGLRKPDIPLGYPCPWAEPRPEDHEAGCMLFAAGDEGFLRAAAEGIQVEWVATSRIYCASEDCDAAWGPEQWLHLGRMLTAPAAVAS